MSGIDVLAFIQLRPLSYIRYEIVTSSNYIKKYKKTRSVKLRGAYHNERI
jgi:hypothetical protein